MKKGKFIVIEGLDASGKSTISTKLAKKYDAVLLNAIPSEIKSWLPKINTTKIAEVSFSYFTLCNILKAREINDYIHSGKNVILDRYFYTTFIYHKELLKNGFPIKIKDVYLNSNMPKPDLVIFLDVPQKIRQTRINERNVELQWYGDAISVNIDLTENYFSFFKELNVNVLKVDNYTNSINKTLKIINKELNILKKILLFDMDGVLVELDNLNFDKNKNKKGYFLNKKPIKGAIEAFNKLNVKYDCYIVTTPVWSNPECWKEKRLWIEKYIGIIANKKLILTHNKNLIQGDFIIDDTKLHGVDKFNGEHIHFGTNNYKNWENVLNYLL